MEAELTVAPGHSLSFGGTLALPGEPEGAELEAVLLVGAKNMTVGVFCPQSVFEGTLADLIVVPVPLLTTWNDTEYTLQGTYRHPDRAGARSTHSGA